MNYEIVNMTDAEKLANYDKIFGENKVLNEQKNYYKQEYDLMVIKYNNMVKSKNKQIRKLETELMVLTYEKRNNNNL